MSASARRGTIRTVPILLLLAAAVILAGVVSVAMGHGGEMAEFAMDYLPPDLVTAADVALLRPPSALWGYNAQVTDEALNRIAQVITERDVEIAVLRQQLAELRSATGSHPAIAATLLARSQAASARGSGSREASTPEAGTREAGTPDAGTWGTSADQAGRAGRAGSRPPARRIRPGLSRRHRAGTCRAVAPRAPPPRGPAPRVPGKRPPAAMTDPGRPPEPGPDGLLRCPWALSAPEELPYHDEEWGRPVRDDRGIFERLCLEAFQSGLSWLTILRKRENFRAAFGGFDPAVVAAFGPDDVTRLLGDAGIIRNRAKITAVIGNARAALAVPGGLAALFWSYAEDPADTRPPGRSPWPTYPPGPPRPRRWPGNCGPRGSPSPARSRSMPRSRPAGWSTITCADCFRRGAYRAAGGAWRLVPGAAADIRFMKHTERVTL